MDDLFNSAMSEESMPTYSKPALMLQCPNCHNVLFVGSRNILHALLESNSESIVYEAVREFLGLSKTIALPPNWKNCYIPSFPETFPCSCGTLLTPISMNEPIFELVENGQNNIN